MSFSNLGARLTRFSIDMLVYSLALALILGSVYFSWNAGMYLAGTLSAFMFVCIALSFCVSVIAQYRPASYWLMIPFAIFFEGVSPFVVNQMEEAKNNALDVAVIEEKLTEAKQAKSLAVKDLELSIERKKIIVEKGASTGSINDEIKQNQNRVDSINEKIDTLRLQVNDDHGDAGYLAIAGMLNTTTEKVSFWMTSLRSLSFFLSTVYILSLVNHRYKLPFDKPKPGVTNSEKLPSKKDSDEKLLVTSSEKLLPEESRATEIVTPEVTPQKENITLTENEAVLEVTPQEKEEKEQATNNRWTYQEQKEWLINYCKEHGVVRPTATSLKRIFKQEHDKNLNPQNAKKIAEELKKETPNNVISIN